MAAKIIQVSNDDGSSFVNLPGNTGDFSSETTQLDNTIFGTDYTSNTAGLISWSVTSNAMYRGVAGYCAKIMKTGTATSFSEEATTQVDSSQVYEITDRAKSVWDWETDVTVEDDGSAVDPSDIEQIYHVQGQVEFVSGYTPAGAITVSGDYLPLESFGSANSISLSQTADTTDTTDFSVCENGGYITQRPTLLTADLELSGFYNASNGLFALLNSRDTFVVEIDPQGNGNSTARGVYTPSTDSQSGDVGADETETFGLTLSVPEGVVPFKWRHVSSSDIPQAVVMVQEAWANKSELLVRYLPQGVGNEGREGNVIVTDVSLEVSVDGMPEFSVTLDGTGEVTVINE